MADGTKIEWTDATWNVVNGCSVTSPGCTNCYAMRLAGTRMKTHPTRAGLTIDTKAGPVWNGQVRFNDQVLLDPLKWRRPRRIFVCAHGDLFHESVPDDWIDKVFAVMAQARHHQFQVLTKRADRMRAYLSSFKVSPMGWLTRGGREPTSYGGEARDDIMPNERWPLPNVWLGVSIEDQARADERVPQLLATPAAVRWLSCEPLLGPVDLTRIVLRDFGERPNEMSKQLGDYVQPLTGNFTDSPRIDWVVAGGESGPVARPMHPDWARHLRDQCSAADVPFLFKQWGEFAPGEVAGDYLDPDRAAKGMSWFDDRWDESWSEPDGHCDDEPDVYRIGKKRAGRNLDGQLHDGFPA
jgi:protein gp37